MNQSKIIFTADDYGVDESINNGIIELVKANVIHSVEVLPNYGENGHLSVENTITLLDETEQINPDLELGVHLTITSGKPLTTSPGLNPILDKGCFIGAKRTNSRAAQYAIYDELDAQIKVLQGNERIWNNVTHLTNHHDALWFFPEYTEMYVELANKWNLPIRNPEVFPRWKEASYYKHFGPLLADSSDKKKSKAAYRLREKGQFEYKDLNYSSTHYLDSSHYSLNLTIFSGDIFYSEGIIKDRQKKLEDIFERVLERHNDLKTPQVVEALFHVRSGDIENSRITLTDDVREALGMNAFDKHDLPFYNGISTSYFDGRSAEFESLMRTHLSGDLALLFQNSNATKGKWSDCINRVLKKKND